MISNRERIDVGNIVLTGFMGTGKTAVGKLLAKRLGYSFVDSDSEIEKEQDLSIAEIFERYGENGFRERESAVIKRLSEGDHVVIATGGGAVLRQVNVDNLKKKGMIICLTASPETIVRRISGTDERPLLRVGNPLERAKELLQLRMPYYERADIMIDTDGKSPLQVADEIMIRLREHPRR